MVTMRHLVCVVALSLLRPCDSQPTGNINVTDGELYVHTADGDDVHAYGIDAVESLFQTLYDMCEYYNTCNKSMHVPDHVKPFLDCCVPCDCSDECMTAGNCCRDKLVDMGHTLIQDGLLMSDNGEICFKVTPAAYMIVNQCHPDYEAGSARDMCEVPSSMSLTELTPVYSKQTNLTYSNIHCARCNYQTYQDIVPWRIKATCDRYVPVRNLESVSTNFLRDGCLISWIPEGHSRICYTPAAPDQCQDERLETLCMNVKGGRPFVDDLLESVCSGCGLPTEEICGPGTFSPPAYQVFINWGVTSSTDAIASESDLKTTRTCPVGETFLENENICLHVTCCPSQLTVSTDEVNCVDPVTDALGLCLDTRLRVTLAFEEIKMSRLEETALEEASKLFPSVANSPFLKLNGGTTIMNSFSTDLYAVYDIRMIQLTLDFVNVSMRYREFESRLRKVTPPSGVSLEAGTAGLSYSPQPLEEVGFLSYSENKSLVACEKMVAMTSLQFCKMVMFSPTEYAIREEDNVLVLSDGLEFESHEYVLRKGSVEEELFVQVCLETFLSRHADANSGEVVVMVWLAMWVSLVCGQTLMYVM